jgi:predicted lactoylglutathione lyase
MKVPVIDTNNFVIYLEEDLNNFFIHCDVKVKWNKKIKKELLTAFKELTKNWNKELYALHTPEDKKHKKFLQMFDFVYCASFIGTDGKEYEIYIWR